MKTRTKGFILSFILVFAMFIGVFTMMPMTASAAGETRTVRVTTFAEMKEALEAEEDTHVIVHNFEQASGRSYYPLIYGIDYEDMDSEDIGYKAVITTPAA